MGELSLSGQLRPIAGMLPMALAAKQAGIKKLYVPADSADEATLAGDLMVYPVENVPQLCAHLRGEEPISRATGSETYPSRFMLVCAMNPCKCGWHGYPGRCKCTPLAVEKYTEKLSGPLLDRIDLYVEVPALEHEEIARKETPAESIQYRTTIIKEA